MLHLQNFWLNGSSFGYFTSFKFVEIPKLFVSCQKFQNFWFNASVQGEIHRSLI